MSQVASETSRPTRPERALQGYLEQSASPLTSLICLLPMVIVYEIGSRWYGIDPVTHVEVRIIAFSKLQQFFDLCGAHWHYMPPAAVAAALLGWHIAQGGAWSVRPTTLYWMHLEMAMYAIPLLTLEPLLVNNLLTTHGPDDWRAALVQMVGAGIYEELLFRLILFVVLSFLLTDLLQMPRKTAVPTMVVISAVLFSAYHYLGDETFELPTFLFRTVAGIYFGWIFFLRGFGITAGTHAAYDISVVLLKVCLHS
jgi:membrane protease YdiL (CAAX protease family)